MRSFPSRWWLKNNGPPPIKRFRSHNTGNKHVTAKNRSVKANNTSKLRFSRDFKSGIVGFIQCLNTGKSKKLYNTCSKNDLYWRNSFVIYFERMTILVIYGVRLIGSHLIRNLAKSHNDYNLINLDSLTYAADLSLLDFARRLFPKQKVLDCGSAIFSTIIAKKVVLKQNNC